MIAQKYINSKDNMPICCIESVNQFIIYPYNNYKELFQKF